MGRFRKLRIDDAAAEFLLEVCGADLLHVDAELDKARDHAGGFAETTVTVETLRDLVTGDESVTGFELSEALLRRDRSAAATWSRRYAQTGEEPLRVLGALAWRARGMVQATALVAAGRDASEAVAALKAWRIARDVPGLLARYDAEEILAFPSKLLAADLALKSRSLPGGAVLEALVHDLLAGGRGRGTP